nr:hypothetical protein [Tanacetum cinerariifolium]
MSLDTYSTTRDLVFDEWVGKILDLRLPRSTRLSYKEISDILLEKIEEDIWKWFYCKHKRSLEEGLTLVENDKDIKKMFKVASYHGTIDLYICHTPQVYLVDYYLKTVIVDDYDEEKNLKDVGNGKGKVLLDDFEAMGKDKAPLCLTNIDNFNDAPTHEMDHVDEKSSKIIAGPAGLFQTDRIHQPNNFNDAPTQEYIRKLYEDVTEGEDFKMLSWVKALEYINDNGKIGGGCFGDINSYLKKGKLEKVVSIITSCKSNMLGDMNVTLKDPSGTISSTIHYKVLLNDDVSKAIKVGSAIILQNVSVFCPKSGEFYLNITIRNLVQIIQNVTVMEDANGASSSNISFQE